MKVAITIMSLLSALVLTGCGSTLREPLADDPYYAPIQAEEPPAQIVNTGSLFNDRAYGLYSDKKARAVGDIITVRLSEFTQASKSAKTAVSKASNASVDPIVGLGGTNATFHGDSIQLGMNSASGYSGDGKADQSNSLTGNISVNVLRVLPNGNLVIRGEKWLTLNTGEEFIRLTGVVRPDDVDSGNEVSSTKIANARIEYSGKGDMAESQVAGWLTRFFTSALWPF